MKSSATTDGAASGTPPLLEADALVIGSGIAGLTFALKVAEVGSVIVVTKKERADSNTNWARGGIAAVVGEDDDLSLHVEDTLAAGGGLSHTEVVRTLVSEGPSRVRELMEWGAEFQRSEGGDLLLGKEGGHSRRRIIHSGDRTGFAIEHALLEAVARNERIAVLEDHLAVDFILGAGGSDGSPVCGGVLALDHRHGHPVTVRARATFLASGGCGQLYLHTTNPSIATGDGVAMAYRAGATIANMEFIQFHPTALFPTEDPAFLISEVLRGEGAVLRRLDGHAFMDGYHPLGSLAPRDVVARAIDRELHRRGEDHVLLDVSSISATDFDRRFPDTARGLRERGIDASRDGIPVVPAAHYVCGGVVTDTAGQTELPGLWAAGEVACTGVHGANRLASNSLLEAVVFSHRAAASVIAALGAPDERDDDRWLPGGGGVESPGVDGARGPGGSVARLDGPADGRAAHASRGEEPSNETGATSDAAATRRELRRLMWDSAGIVRRVDGLDSAARRLAELGADEEERWRSSSLTPEGVELRNMIVTAELIVACARARHESRGLHHVEEYPGRDNERFLRDTFIRRPEGDA